MIRRFRSALLVTSLGILTFSAYSQPARASFVTLMSEKKWLVAEEIDPLLQTTVCRAYTQSTDLADGLELSLSYPKDGRILPAITIKTKAAAPLLSVKVSRDLSEPLFLLQAAATPGENNLYWYAPLDFARLEKFIREKNVLEAFLDPKGTPVPVKISLAGSANALSQVRQCLAGTKFPTEFMALLNQAKDALNPDLGERTPAFLLKTTQTAFDAYLAGKAVEEQIAILRKPAAPLLRKEEKALASQQYALRKATEARTELDEILLRVKTIEQNLSSARAALAELISRKAAADADFAAKKAVYLPLKEQMAAQDKKVAQARQLVKSLEDQIESAQNTIRRGERSIAQLQSEQRGLERALPGLRDEKRRAQNEYSRADSEYNAFNYDRERRDILDRDFSYSSLLRERDSAERDLDRAIDQARNAAYRVNDAERRLQSCRSQPDARCDSEERDLNNAIDDHNRARREGSDAESRLGTLNSRIRSAENDAERRARSMQDDLRQKRDSAYSRYNSASNEVSNAEDRIASIRQQIPSLRRQVEKARDSLPGLNSQLQASQVALEQTIRERDEFARNIGFDVAEREYLAAQAVVKQLADAIAARNKEIPALEKELVRANREIAPAQKELARRELDLGKANQALAAIREQLKPLREKEAVLVAELTKQTDLFKLNRAIYQDLFQELARQ